MEISRIVTRIGQQLGLEGWSLDENGAGAFTSPGGLHVEVLSLDNGARLNLIGVLGSRRSEDDAPWMLELLNANTQVNGLSAASFGYVRETREVLLYASVPTAPLEPEDIDDVLDQFVERASFEQMRLADVLHAA
jgi:hypothetical protein